MEEAGAVIRDVATMNDSAMLGIGMLAILSICGLYACVFLARAYSRRQKYLIETKQIQKFRDWEIQKKNNSFD